MKIVDQRGVIDSWLIAFIVVLCLFLGSTGFGVWAFMERQDYKDNVEPKIAAAVASAEETKGATKDKEFLEKEKQPLRVYTGPASFGSVSISYPKTWSVYVDESEKGTAPLDGSFNPGFVPGLQSNKNTALRFQILNTSYAQAVRILDSAVKTGKVTATPITVAKVPSAVGLRFNGEIVSKKNGSMVILPLRDKSLKIWTEADQFVADFDTIILPNITFVP